MASNHDRERLAPPWIPPAAGRANRSQRVIFVDRRQSLDPDAAAYITAVEAADGQALEAGVRAAINAFVIGCKADGVWTPIKASCILAGARTLSGALVPLVGSAPTNVNFVSGDYNRETGLLGDASTKYLNTNRNSNADPQNSNHQAVYVTAAPTITTNINSYIGAGSGGVSGATHMIANPSNASIAGRSRQSAAWTATQAATITGFIGQSRTSASAHTFRANTFTQSFTTTSQAPLNENVLVFARNPSNATFSSARMAFYSVGEAVDMALLRNRLDTLINAIAAAIP